MSIKSTITVLSTLILLGCGGGGGSSSSTPVSSPTVTPPATSPTTFTGMFLDSAVEGLSYSTESDSGFTNSDGEFIYQIDETIEFSIGDIVFPSMEVRSVLTPLDMFDTQDINHQSVINVLRLLQSLDLDGDPDNGIEISSQVHELATGLTVDFASTEFDSSVAELVEMSGNLHQELVTAEMAVYHFQTTLAAISNDDISTCESTHESVGYFGYFNTRAHNVSGRAEIIDDCTIKITEFYYDGGGPDVVFYAAIDHQYDDESAFPISQQINGREYQNSEFILRLPDNKTLDDLNGLSVWCVDFAANFGEMTFSP